jgi:hypothetical protein
LLIEEETNFEKEISIFTLKISSIGKIKLLEMLDIICIYSFLDSICDRSTISLITGTEAERIAVASSYKN